LGPGLLLLCAENNRRYFLSNSTRAEELGQGDDEMEERDDGELHARSEWRIAGLFCRLKFYRQPGRLNDSPCTGWANLVELYKRRRFGRSDAPGQGITGVEIAQVLLAEDGRGPTGAQ
jgi:hypothetical protein